MPRGWRLRGGDRRVKGRGHADRRQTRPLDFSDSQEMRASAEDVASRLRGVEEAEKERSRASKE